MGFGDFIQGIGKGLDGFSKNRLGPALEHSGKALDNFGHEKLVPALGKAGKALDDFGHEKLGPALGEARITFSVSTRVHINKRVIVAYRSDN
jgi:hypothetical protein